MQFVDSIGFDVGTRKILFIAASEAAAAKTILATKKQHLQQQQQKLWGKRYIRLKLQLLALFLFCRLRIKHGAFEDQLR